MEVGIEDDPRVDLKTFVLPTMLESIYQDVAPSRSRENGKPRNGTCGDEMCVGAFEDSVPAAHKGEFGGIEAKLRR
jgi:hypothetical protein